VRRTLTFIRNELLVPVHNPGSKISVQAAVHEKVARDSDELRSRVG
jgi:hypothetical protein